MGGGGGISIPPRLQWVDLSQQRAEEQQTEPAKQAEQTTRHQPALGIRVVLPCGPGLGGRFPSSSLVTSGSSTSSSSSMVETHGDGDGDGDGDGNGVYDTLAGLHTLRLGHNSIDGPIPMDLLTRCVCVCAVLLERGDTDRMHSSVVV